MTPEEVAKLEAAAAQDAARHRGVKPADPRRGRTPSTTQMITDAADQAAAAAKPRQSKPAQSPESSTTRKKAAAKKRRDVARVPHQAKASDAKRRQKRAEREW